MTDPHERPPLPTGTQEHVDPAATQELDGEAMQNELRMPDEVDPPYLVDAAPVETSDVEAAADESGAENVVGPAVSDTDHPATSRREKRAQKKRAGGKKRALLGAGAGTVVAGALIASQLLSAGGKTEAPEPEQSADAEDVVPGNQTADDPAESGTIIVEEPEPTQEPETNETDLNLPEATGTVDGPWQEDRYVNRFAPLEEMSPKEFFEEVHQEERFVYLAWKAAQFGLEQRLIEVDQEGFPDNLDDVPVDALLDAYNELIHVIVPRIHAESGVDAAKKALYAATADPPQELAGPQFDFFRDSWLDAIENYPNKPIDSGPYAQAIPETDSGALYRPLFRQVNAETGQVGLSLTLHLDVNAGTYTTDSFFPEKREPGKFYYAVTVVAGHDTGQE